jgi:hypothetical protein
MYGIAIRLPLAASSRRRVRGARLSLREPRVVMTVLPLSRRDAASAMVGKVETFQPIRRNWRYRCESVDPCTLNSADTSCLKRFR